MIIKSKSRSNKSFSQLYTYFCNETDAKLYSYNLFSNPYNKKAVVQEFEINSEFLQNSIGRNYLYHEILSISTNSLEAQQSQKALLELAHYYLKLRGENHLALMAMHTHKQHLHMHLMISANEIESSKRKRLSKKEFASIQKELEAYTTRHFSQLRTFHYQDFGSDKSKKTSKEQELYSRTKTSKKQSLKERFSDILHSSQNIQEFKTKLIEANISLYTRGKSDGIIFEDKKYRLSSLDLSTLYHEKLLEWEQKNIQKTDEKTNIQRVIEFIQKTLSESRSKQEFLQKLFSKHYEFYERKFDAEILIDNKWYTLNSLNFAREYHTKKRAWELDKDFKAKTAFRDKNQKIFDEYEQQV